LFGKLTTLAACYSVYTRNVRTRKCRPTSLRCPRICMICKLHMTHRAKAYVWGNHGMLSCAKLDASCVHFPTVVARS